MAGTLQLKIITPSHVAFDRPVRMVVLRTVEGEIGILPGHEKSALLLDFSEVRIFEEEQNQQSETMAVLGGFASVTKTGVTILSEFADHPDRIDQARVDMLKARAESQKQDKSTDVNIQRAEAALRRSLVRGERSGSVVMDEIHFD